MSKKLPFKPHARLLTMLGDQLIKNERVALIEILKNSYDADASWVKVSFLGFGPNFEVSPASRIVIEDDGVGMDDFVFEKHWVNPATPLKKLAKLQNDTTAKGRKIQGEKGIGRFALLKLGKTLTIVSRPKDKSTEYRLKLDLSIYDDDFLTDGGTGTKTILLDDISAILDRSHKAVEIESVKMTLGLKKIVRKPHGTRIEVSALRNGWSERKVEEVAKDSLRLQSIFDSAIAEVPAAGHGSQADFSVYFYKDGKYKPYSDTYVSDLKRLMHENAVFRIENGVFDADTRRFNFTLNGRNRVLALSDAEITGDKLFKDYFGRQGEHLQARGIACGSFSFGFYIFDPSNSAPGKYHLDKEDRDQLKEHRIYLYRDNVRVYPYGDPSDDWLRIDQLRGTISAGWFLSNDQVVGCVNISQRANPSLIDKTSREGLLETGQPHEDFLHLLQIFLRWVRAKPYARYRLSIEEQKDVSVFKLEKVAEGLHDLEASIGDNKKALAAANHVRRLYEAERKYLVRRAEVTEALAGVGLSVETATHDIMAVMNKALLWIDNLVRDASGSNEVDKEELNTQLTTLRGMLSFVESQLRDVQLLFRSTKQRRRDLRVVDILEKVARIYKSTMDKVGITYRFEQVGPPLIAKTTDAVLLQLFLNLFDNSVYWLESVRRDERKISVMFDGDEQIAIFSDTGPGILPSDTDYIFEPFYSGKGEDGRGLGLHIARQLLERHDYSISLADVKRQQRLRGANFVVSFVRKEL